MNQQPAEPTPEEIRAFLAEDAGRRQAPSNQRRTRAEEAVDIATRAGIRPELNLEAMAMAGRPEQDRRRDEELEIAAFLQDDAARRPGPVPADSNDGVARRQTTPGLPVQPPRTALSLNDITDQKNRETERTSIGLAAGAVGREDEKRSLLATTVDRASQPLVPQIADAGRSIADAIDGTPRDSRHADLSADTLRDVLKNLVGEPLATLRGAAAGVAEGVGQVASQMTSPLYLVLTTVPGGAALAKARRALKASKALNATQGVVSGALGIRGAERIVNGDTPSEKLLGLTEAAAGLAGVAGARSRPSPAGRTGELPVQPPKESATVNGRPVDAPTVPAESAQRRTVLDAIQASRRARESTRYRQAQGLPVLVADGKSARPPGAGAMDGKQRSAAVRLDKFPEEIRADLGAVIDRNQGFETQRRGVQPVDRTKALADRLAVDLSQSKKAGTALNAEELHAYANAVSTVQDRIRQSRSRIVEGNATDVDLLELQKLLAEHEVVTRTFTGARTEAGRSLNILKQTARVLESHDIRLIRQAIEQPGLRGNLSKLAEELAAIGDDPVKQLDFLRSKQKLSAWDVASGYYYGNLLSGLKTHERNVIGNAANSLSSLAVHPVASAIDAAKSAATGQPRRLYFGEMTHQAAGSLIGMQRGFKDAMFSLRHGFSPLKATEAFDLPRKELPGGGGNPWNWPGRALESADLFFRSIATHQERYGAAYAAARRAVDANGVTGAKRAQAIEGRMADLLTGDGPDARAIAAGAERFGERAVFREDPGKVVTGLMNLKRDFPALGFVVPFIRTPANIIRQGAEFSPAGLALKAARQGGRAGSQAQGRAALGSLLLAPVAWMAAQGRISGSGPSDSSERSALMDTGWRPNSVRLPLADAVAKAVGASRSPNGEYWVSYTLFQPLSVAMSTVANGFEEWRAGEGSDRSAAEVSAKVLGRTVQSVYQQSFLSGLSSLLDAVSDPKRYGEAFAQQLATGFVPLSGLQRNITHAVDPVIRRPEGVGDAIKSITPGLSTTLEPRIDRFGEPLTRSGTAIRRGFLVPEIEPTLDDPVSAELERLGVSVGLPSDRLVAKDPNTGAAIVPTDRDEYVIRTARGRAVREAIAAAMNEPAYTDLSGEAQAALLKQAITQSRRFVSDRAREALSHSQRLDPDQLTPGSDQPTSRRPASLQPAQEPNARETQVQQLSSAIRQHQLATTPDLKEAARKEVARLRQLIRPQ